VRQIDVSIWGRVFFCRVRPFIPLGIALALPHSSMVVELIISAVPTDPVLNRQDEYRPSHSRDRRPSW
jgi:hypothetical protein